MANAFIDQTLVHNFKNGAGFFGSKMTTQAAAPTAAHATITQAGTDTGDVAIQAATSTTPYGFVNAAEFEAVLAVVINNAARLSQVITALQSAGIMAT